MPYGRKRTYRRMSRYATAGAAAKLQKKAKSAYTKRKPVKRAARPMVNKNAIDILARRVARLTRSQYGSVQRVRQRAEVNGEVWGHTKPMAICVENIYTSSRVYSGHWDLINNTPRIFVDATFDKYSLRNGADGVNSASIPDAYNYWAGAQDDTVSFEKFLPISSYYDITFSKEMAPLDEDIWIRVDVVQVRKHMLHSPSHMLALPDNLQGLKNMAVSPTSQEHQKNAYNPQYFKVLKTRWVKLSCGGQRYYVNSDSVTQTANTLRNYQQVERHIKIFHKFPKKLIVPDLKTTDNINDDFVRSQEPEHLTWMIFNVSCAAHAPNIYIRRTSKWRDADGIAS